MSDATEERRWRGAEITVSDSHRGVDADDRSGDVIVARFALLPADVIARESVPDDIDRIRAAVRQCAASADILILTGGTGLGPRDVTPQALLPMFDYRSEEHTSELQSPCNLVCRLLLEKKKKSHKGPNTRNTYHRGRVSHCV